MEVNKRFIYSIKMFKTESWTLFCACVTPRFALLQQDGPVRSERRAAPLRSVCTVRCI
jgi:hypothetical protein